MYTHVALHRIRVALKELGLLLFYHAPMFVCFFLILGAVVFIRMYLNFIIKSYILLKKVCSKGIKIIYVNKEIHF